MVLFRTLLIVVLISFSTLLFARDEMSVDVFIDKMVSEHDFDSDKLKELFGQTKVSQTILDAISRPAEKLPWYKYRKIFLKENRIKQGVSFWHENMHTLDRAEEVYGVAPEIIVAIIGVETLYGRITGSYRVMDALTTLGFHYPKRAKFFRGQLEQFLLLSREQDIDPMSLKGSYAGAMGIPQFIPGSYRNYAADFDKDGKINIWSNKVDAIGSVARYFKLHGWKKGEAVAEKLKVKGNNWKSAVRSDLKPDLTLKQLAEYGIKPSVSVDTDAKMKLIELEMEQGSELWLGYENFYVITRYNHSALYAMAVFQLSQSIKQRFLNDSKSR